MSLSAAEKLPPPFNRVWLQSEGAQNPVAISWVSRYNSVTRLRPRNSRGWSELATVATNRMPSDEQKIRWILSCRFLHLAYSAMMRKFNN